MNTLKCVFFCLGSFLLYSRIEARHINVTNMPASVLEELVTGPCKAVTFVHGWPCFWKCSKETFMPSFCKDAVQKIKLKTRTHNDRIFCHQNVGGCVTLSQKVTYAKSYHFKDDIIILCTIVCLSFAFTSITMITFLIRMEKISRQTDVILIYNNLCWMIVSICWIVQFFSRPEIEIFNLDDGAIQQHLELDRYICGISFVLLYFFTLTGVAWFVVLTYCWYTEFPERGSHKDSRKEKIKYFHICAWCIPLFLTVAMAMTQARGICFRASNINLGFVLANMAYILGGFFLALSLINVVKERLNSKELESRKDFRPLMLRRGFIAICLVMICCISFTCQAYDFNNRKDWEESSQDYANCLVMNSTESALNGTESSSPKCVLKSKPNVFLFVIHMLCHLIFGNLVSLLLWNKVYLNVFKYYFCSCCAMYCDGLKSDFVPPPPQPPSTPPNRRKLLKKNTKETIDFIVPVNVFPSETLVSFFSVNDNYISYEHCNT